MNTSLWIVKAAARLFCQILLVAVALLAAGPARADEDGIFGRLMGIFANPPEIHLPRPEIHLPRLDITPFWTNDLKQGRDAYARGEYGRARDAFMRSADEGNIIAEWYLGHMYRLGRGVPVDAATAYSYFSRVADNFTPDEQDPNRLRITVDAQIRVADYLRLGIPSAHLKANSAAAARTYLQMATNFGHPRAFYGLGVMSVEGEGMRKNTPQGLKWLTAAARKHSGEAAAYLGDLSAEGDEVQQDDAKALTWYIIAAQNVNQDEIPQITARLTQLRFAATEDTRLEAEARARVWNEQNPREASQ